MDSQTTARTGLGLLIVRIGLGVVMIAHGWQKFSENTVEGTTQGFTQMGVPLPQIAAPGVIVLELFGGAALILGLLTPLVSAAYALTMLGASILVHAPNGFFASGGGYELTGLLAVLSLGLAIAGAGRYSLDHALIGRRRERTVSERSAVLTG